MTSKALKSLTFALSAAFLLASGALAEVPDISGTYEVKSAGAKDRSVPDCVIIWHLRKDGSYLVKRDQEEEQGLWRVDDRGRNDLWLEWTPRTTNGLPGCGGRVAKLPLEAGGTPFYVSAGRGLFLTTPPQVYGKDLLEELLAVATRIGD